MGASFNYVIVPKKIQDLKDFYENTRQKLIDDYGDEFEGYSGDMAVDNGDLEIKKNISINFGKYKKELKQNSFDKDYDAVEQMCDSIEHHAEKWGPSVAIKVNDQWVICGFYSD